MQQPLVAHYSLYTLRAVENVRVMYLAQMISIQFPWNLTTRKSLPSKKADFFKSIARDFFVRSIFAYGMCKLIRWRFCFFLQIKFIPICDCYKSRCFNYFDLITEHINNMLSTEDSTSKCRICWYYLTLWGYKHTFMHLCVPIAINQNHYPFATATNQNVLTILI